MSTDNSACLIYVHWLFQKPDGWTPPQGCHTTPWQPLLITKYIDFILYTPVKVLIIILTLVNLGISIYGAVQLKVDFEPTWYLEQQSDILKMRNDAEKYFPAVKSFKGN